MVSRLLVLAGVAVTLVGVVMLLVLAAQHGLFRPPIRVAGGALLAVALVVTGWRVMDRPGGRVGGTALMATGFAGAYLDVLAVTTVYDWIAPPVGLALALVCAVSGVVVAMRWNNQLLALIVTLGCAALAPVLTSGLTLTLVAFLAVLQIAGSVPELVRSWMWLAPARTVPAVVAILVVIPMKSIGTDAVHPQLLAAAAVIGATGLSSGLLALRRRSDDVVAAVSMVLSCLPVVLVANTLGTTAAAAWSAGVAAIVIVAGFATRPLGTPARFALASVIVLAVFQGCALLSADYSTAMPFLVTALVVAAAAVQQRSVLALAGASALYAVGMQLLLMDAGPRTLSSQRQAIARLDEGALLSGLLGVATAALLVLAVLQMRTKLVADLRRGIVVSAGLAALYSATVVAVAAGVTAMTDEDGFYLGHFLATAVWIAAAYGLLTLGLNRPAYAHLTLGAGLTLVAAALTKLFVFDLAALGGVARAGSFLVVGLLLLVAGTRYARSFAEREAGTHA
ncbi:hypothetical protein VV02_06160 [Luteipulveratus mongoliensis]|uniref:DUF2339 domain-containing protein n=2 Tax=Luteipulveratus mongoliensis TaxID=571913 RepID=A0A0K1JFQ3_9MICO|nr:hypothetical protein VV02_06160 [Luteipulveratus mongoliensis]